MVYKMYKGSYIGHGALLTPPWPPPGPRSIPTGTAALHGTASSDLPARKEPGWGLSCHRGWHIPPPPESASGRIGVPQPLVLPGGSVRGPSCPVTVPKSGQSGLQEHGAGAQQHPWSPSPTKRATTAPGRSDAV